MQRCYGVWLAIALTIQIICVYRLSAQDTADTVITGATLIDGTGNAPLPNAVVIIRNGSVQAVGQAGKLPYPASAKVIDANGKFIIPGLFDSHVHYRDWVGELFLAYGITSVIDMGNPVDWVKAQKEAIEKGKIVGPRIFASGDALGQRFRNVSGDLSAKDLEQIRNSVRNNIAQGASHISVTVTTDPRAVPAIIDEAHKAGVPVSAYTMYPKEQIGSGLDALQHSYSLSAGSKRDPGILEAIRNEANRDDTPRYAKHPLNYRIDAEPSDFIQLLAKRKIYIIPSMIFEYKLFNDHRAEFERQNLELLQNPGLRYVNYEDYFLQLTSGTQYGIPRLGGPGFFGTIDFESAEFKEYQQSYRNLQKLVKAVSDGGGNVLAGTDAPNMLLPGISLHQEMELLVDAGLTPMQVIVSATSKPAAYVHRQNDLGTIAPGHIADLLILDANPLDDIRNTRKIRTVVQAGRVLDTSFHPNFANPIPRPNANETQRNPLPQVRDVFPKAATEGDHQAEITVRGSNFIYESVVLFDGQRVPTTFVSDTQVKAVIPAPLLQRVGTFPVSVWNPKPQGGTSGDAKFIVAFR